MANNRAYLYCESCNEAVCFIKTGNDVEWYRSNVPEADIDAFLEEHAVCSSGPGSGASVRYEKALKGLGWVELPVDATIFRGPQPATGSASPA